jgi:hypothetical protein
MSLVTSGTRTMQVYTTLGYCMHWISANAFSFISTECEFENQHSELLPLQK